jgi:4-hydroxybenzoyl-CoA reductase subunit beta
LRDFYTGDGENYRNLLPTELLTRVCLPAESADHRGLYRKLRVRGSIDYPLAGVAVRMKRSNAHVADARIAITAVNPAPLLLQHGGEMLIGKAVDEGLADAVGDLAARTAKPLTTSALTPE